jgi:DNA-directed RNA polymerase subunit beta'
VIVGRLIPAGTGYAHHAERRRTREQDLADQLKELEEEMQVAESIEESGEEVTSEEVVEEAVVAEAAEAPAAPEGDEPTPAV